MNMVFSILIRNFIDLLHKLSRHFGVLLMSEKRIVKFLCSIPTKTWLDVGPDPKPKPNLGPIMPGLAQEKEIAL